MADANTPNKNQELERAELGSERQGAQSSEQGPLLALNFNGRAQIKDERKHKEEILEIIPLLNNKNQSISEEIKIGVTQLD